MSPDALVPLVEEEDLVVPRPNDIRLDEPAPPLIAGEGVDVFGTEAQVVSALPTEDQEEVLGGKAEFPPGCGQYKVLQLDQNCTWIVDFTMAVDLLDLES